MFRETQRRVSILGLVALVSAAVAAIGAGVDTGKAGAVASVAPQAQSTPITFKRAPCSFPRALRPAFKAAARDTKLPTSLLYAVATIESNLRPDVTSEAGAHGLLQVMPSTGAMLKLDIKAPESNVLAGARYLRQMLDQFGSSDVALAAYNAGPTAVSKAGGAPSGAVLSYVANVTRLWHLYAACR